VPDRDQELVYRSGPADHAPVRPVPADAGVLPPALQQAQHVIVWSADPVALFRFSALTANAHRIHYDWPYAVDVEHYPGLVVHGLLLAIVMAGAATHVAGDKEAQQAGQHRLRLLRPVFAGDRVYLSAATTTTGAEVRFLDRAGDVLADLTATLTPPQGRPGRGRPEPSRPEPGIVVVPGGRQERQRPWTD
jgi:hydroxyacyl-ACP dehydratase HTD2-like protein with hotdog domain